MTRKLIFPILVLSAVYYALFGGEYSVFEVRHARAERVDAQEELVQLRAEIDALRDRAESLESDPAELEQLAREKFGMIRDGELLYRIVPEPAPEDAEEDPNGEDGSR